MPRDFSSRPREAAAGPVPALFSGLFSRLFCASGALFSATAMLLALFCALQAWSLWRAPAAWYPAAISVKPAGGESVALGQNELAAPQADRRHIALRRDAQGAWWIRNLSAAKQVVLQKAGQEERMGNARLQAGQAFQVGEARFEVEAASDKAVGFARDGHHWLYDGALLYRDGQALAACPDDHLAARALALWERIAPRFLAIGRTLTFGGNVYCDNRLGLDGVTPGAAWMARIDGQLELASGSPDGERAALLLARDGAEIDLRRQEQPLAGVEALVVGHTRFQLSRQDGALTLVPSRRVTLFSAPDATPAAAISWSWRQRSLWRAGQGQGDGQERLWTGLGVTLAALLASLVLPRRSAWLWRSAALAAAALLLTGLAALLMQRGGHAPSAAASMLVAVAALWLWVLMPGRLPL
ncbi:MAG TPA: hypothetical protein VGP06_04325, partial [Janthinobacterium sp.]|nr:hypothetical protein [Janthinobacterium sp.]